MRWGDVVVPGYEAVTLLAADWFARRTEGADEPDGPGNVN